MLDRNEISTLMSIGEACFPNQIERAVHSPEDNTTYGPGKVPAVFLRCRVIWPYIIPSAIVTSSSGHGSSLLPDVIRRFPRTSPTLFAVYNRFRTDVSEACHPSLTVNGSPNRRKWFAVIQGYLARLGIEVV